MLTYLPTQEASSSKLIYPASDIVRGCDLEFFRMNEQLYTYVCVHSQSVPPWNGDPTKALVSLKIGEETQTEIGYRHAGGQKVSLPISLQTSLISALQKNQPVAIELQGYKTTIEPKKFASYFAKLYDPPIRNHFNTPLNS